MNAIDAEEIVEARIQGESIRSISKRLGVSVEDINDCLDRFAKITISKNLRTHTLALELERLDRLQRAFERQAEAGDVQAAALCQKIIERRCVMLGISAPPRVDAQLIEAVNATPKQDSISRIYAAIERIQKLPKPDGEAEPPSGNGRGFYRDEHGAFHFHKSEPEPEADEPDPEPPTNGEGEAN
jgi:hypothetical protein